MKLIILLVFDEDLREVKILRIRSPLSFKYYLNSNNQLWFQQYGSLAISCNMLNAFYNFKGIEGYDFTSKPKILKT